MQTQRLQNLQDVFKLLQVVYFVSENIRTMN